MADDNIVTVRDIYALVQEVNTRVVALNQQVTTLTERAGEDRAQVDAMSDEMQSLKVKVYASVAAFALVYTMMSILGQFSVLTGKA